MPYARIRPRRGTTREWNEANPILQEGEIGFLVPDSGIGKGLTIVKIGDGSSKWTELPVGIAGTTLDLLKAANKKEIVLTPDAFTKQNTGIADYPYRATVENPYVLAQGRVHVDVDQATSNLGVLSIENDSFDGYFYIYASEKPSGNVRIIGAEMTMAVE